MTFAVGLDIGSNTFSVVELKRETEGLRIIQDASYAVRLSEGMGAKGADLLRPQAITRGLATLVQIAEGFHLGSVPLRAVGTAVLRRAKNREMFTKPAADILGAQVEILSGQDEARLVGKGAQFGLDKAGPSITADVGGQSTELVFSQADGRTDLLSMPLGALELTSRFFPDDPPSSSHVVQLRRHVVDVLRRAVPRHWKGEFVAVAGTATTLAAIDLALTEWRREKVHGLNLTRNQIKKWLDTMLLISTHDRITEYHIGSGRADIFPAGLIVLDELLHYFKLDAFTVSAYGLRYGVALELLEGMS